MTEKKLGNDLIHADELQHSLEYLFKIADLRKLTEEMRTLRKVMNVLARTQRVPVHRARWMADTATTPGPGLENFRCSRCGGIGGSWVREIKIEDAYKYCPWCGAEMMEVLNGN